MKALVKTALGPGNLELREVPTPRPGWHDVLVKIAAAGICGTDALILQDAVRIYNPPVILGHNLAGTVAAAGEGVKAWLPGDRVAIDMNVGACGTCEYCRNQQEYLCTGRRGLGYGIDGGMADYLCVDERWLVKVPEGVPLTEAAIMDFSNAVHGVIDCGAIGYNTSVVISGPGFQGLAMLQVARLVGASPVIVVGLERHASRLQLARDLGADAVVASDRQDLSEVVAGLSGGRGFDVVLETSGDARAANLGIQCLRKGGRLAVIGSLPSESTIDLHTVVYSELKLTGIRGYNRRNVEFFLSALAAGKLNLKPFVQTFPLEDWPQAFEARKQRKVIEPVLLP